MTARTGMTDIITKLRGHTNAGTADYTIGTAAYWSDDQLQNVLDAHRLDFYANELEQITAMESGAVVYKTYRAPYRNLEGGTVNFLLVDFQGTPAGTADYTADYPTGAVTFAADQAGKAWYLTGRSYDIYAAAADVWRSKAAHAAETSFDFSTDNHRVSGGQIHEHCLKMAAHYDGMALSTTTVLMRGDIDEYALD